MTETQEPAPPPEIEYNRDGDIHAPTRMPHDLQVDLPAEPPQLNPQAAKALLHLLKKARPPRAAADRSEDA